MEKGFLLTLALPQASSLSFWVRFCTQTMIWPRLIFFRPYFLTFFPKTDVLATLMCMRIPVCVRMHANFSFRPTLTWLLKVWYCSASIPGA